MSDAAQQTSAWKRIHRLRFIHRFSFIPFINPLLVAFIALDRTWLHLNLHWGYYIFILIFLFLALALPLTERKLMRAVCPSCGDRLFARVPPKHYAEEYFAFNSPQCANCGIEISAQAP